MEWDSLKPTEQMLKNKKIFDNIVLFSKKQELKPAQLIKIIIENGKLNRQFIDNMFSNILFSCYADGTKRKVLTMLRYIAEILHANNELTEGEYGLFGICVKGDIWTKNPPETDIDLDSDSGIETEEDIQEYYENFKKEIDNCSNILHKHLISKNCNSTYHRELLTAYSAVSIVKLNLKYQNV